MDVRCYICENFLSTFPTLMLLRNVLMTDRCVTSLKIFSDIPIQHFWAPVRKWWSTSSPTRWNSHFWLQEATIPQRSRTSCGLTYGSLERMRLEKEISRIFSTIIAVTWRFQLCRPLWKMMVYTEMSDRRLSMTSIYFFKFPCFSFGELINNDVTVLVLVYFIN